MEVVLPLVSRRLMALVAVHGVVDAASHRALWYAPLLLPPAPCRLDAFLFALASLAHFGADVGLPASAALHALLGALHLAGRTGASTAVLLAYFAAVHLPLVVAKRRTRRESVALALGFAAAAVAPGAVCDRLLGARAGAFALAPRLQRAITCHVLANTV